ncbi:hypothetical protein [Tellurirhabdus bombi]|uniref:hypothetical protein n=1 Tax=Tellurirhabdus bombi TaxID=2907205 RepID=UPI001F295482|nr:hypothetical protein [Tellurirhabdus bombi]
MKTQLLALTGFLVLACSSPQQTESNPGSLAADSSLTKITSTPKINLFTHVDSLRNQLSRVGIGELKPWSSDGKSWLAATDFYEFGPGNADGFRDNLAFFLESGNKQHVRKLQLTMLRYRKGYQSKSQSTFANKTELLFELLKTTLPEGLLRSIRTGRNFRAETPEFVVSTRLDAGPTDADADYYRLTLISK